jgi:hypothetical protein
VATLSRIIVAILLLIAAPLSHGERATERYAPAQLRVAQDLLERARAAAVLGDFSRAGRLAWQASLDARLAWAMTESEQLRAEAARIGGAAAKLIAGLARSADR